MSETQDERRERGRRWTSDRERCRVCGRLRINVVHEPDPDNAPEGKAYYAAIRGQLHAFVPGGGTE